MLKFLSLFDGISVAQLALQRHGIVDYEYYASEIEINAIKVTQKNFPKTIQVGDIRKVNVRKTHFDAIFAGFPCQGFSFAGLQLNFEDERSKLFFELIRIFEQCKKINPDIKFIFENVRMQQRPKKIISDFIGCEPIFICSSNFSAQKRKRLYWTNFKISELKECLQGSVLNDVIHQCGDNNDYYLNEKEIQRAIMKHSPTLFSSGKRNGRVKFPTPINEKSKCLNTLRIKASRDQNHIIDGKGIRLLNRIEYERLQTLPEGYTDCISNNAAFKAIGNSWNTATISHILTHS